MSSEALWQTGWREERILAIAIVARNKLARELLIREGLVGEGIDARLPFLVHNRRLIAEIEDVAFARIEVRLAQRLLQLDDGAGRIDFVYNRLTDFALAAASSRALREAYLAGAAVISPHPRAHALFAARPKPTVRRKRSWASVVAPKISDSRPCPTRRWNSICQRRSCAIT